MLLQNTLENAASEGNDERRLDHHEANGLDISTSKSKHAFGKYAAMKDLR